MSPAPAHPQTEPSLRGRGSRRSHPIPLATPSVRAATITQPAPPDTGHPMRTLTLIALILLPTLLVAQDTKDTALDTSYLKDHALTRGFMLGRPVRPKVSPDGKTVLFLRAKPRQAKMSLFEFDVASGKTKELLT